jgi:hypothetical protein
MEGPSMTVEEFGELELQRLREREIQAQSQPQGDAPIRRYVYVFVHVYVRMLIVQFYSTLIPSLDTRSCWLMERKIILIWRIR